MGPDNVLMGDTSQITELPQTPRESQEEALRELNKKAKYSRSKEFQELKEKMQDRITFYQSFLPGNIPVEQVSEEERGKYWAVANMVIGELQAVIDMYEGAQKVLDEQK